MKFVLILITSLLIHSYGALGQVAYTANDRVDAYEGPFSFGVNGGYFGDAWLGDNLGEIILGSSGAGGTGIRYTLPNHFLETWGYKINLQVYEEDRKRGALDNLVFLEGPSEVNIDETFFCRTQKSKIFKNLYLPIWDNNFDTPINENNPYALYVYKTVGMYKNYVKFWEIWNEPDFTTSTHGWETIEQPLSWHNKNPDPCDLTNLQAPVQYYVRLLRISYEVIKAVDPTAYITTGGIGYDSFLDAVLRNTDNPQNGMVASGYPLKGGAYFDVLSFHHYPQYSVGGKRHSDAAAHSIKDHLVEFKKVLYKHGYDGVRYPEKEYITSEINISRKPFDGYIGGEVVQRNFLIKAVVEMAANQIKQMYLYGVSDSKTEVKATNSYDLMGLYESLSEVKLSGQKLTTQGIAFKTLSGLLRDASYDADRTARLNLPGSVGGGTFKKGESYLYVLWAKTTLDNDESAKADYTFPRDFNLRSLSVKRWDNAVHSSIEMVSANKISLTGTPIFLHEEGYLGISESQHFNKVNIQCSPNPFSNQCAIGFWLEAAGEINIDLLNMQGQIIRTLYAGDYINEGEQSFKINTTDLPAGTYLLKIACSQGVAITKLVKVP